MRIEIVAADDARETLVNLMQLYLYDMSEFSGEDVETDGRYVYGYLADYWIESVRHPFLFQVGGIPAGFGLVREFEPGNYSMAEFFVMRKFRREGVGRHAARALFDRFSGTWHVAQEEENTAAQAFWRTIIGEYSSGQFREGRSDEPDGPMQIFESA